MKVRVEQEVSVAGYPRASARRLVALICVLVLFVPPAVAAPAADGPESPARDSGPEINQRRETPSHVIESLHQVLNRVIGSPQLNFQERCEAILGGVTAVYDIEFMAIRSLGAHGKKLDTSERESWMNAFSRFTAATYARRLENSSGRFEEIDEKPLREDTILVRGRVVRPSTSDVPINYRLHLRDGQWKVIDVYAGGTISELALRRAELTSLLDTMTFSEVVVYVNDMALER